MRLQLVLLCSNNIHTKQVGLGHFIRLATATPTGVFNLFPHGNAVTINDSTSLILFSPGRARALDTDARRSLMSCSLFRKQRIANGIGGMFLEKRYVISNSQ